MNRFRSVWVGLVLCAGTSTVTDVFASEKTAAQWPAIDALVQAGKLDEAFQTLQAQPAGDAIYFYNLGTLAYRLGKLGPALAYLEKADRLTPHDPDIHHNAEVARADLARKLGADRLDPASSWTEQLADHVPMAEIRGALGLIGLILSLYWLGRYVKLRDARLVFLTPASILGCLGLVVVLALYVAERLAEEHPAAVSLAHDTVRSGPGEQYSQLGEVEAGVKVRLLGPRATSGTPDQMDDILGQAAPAPSGKESEMWLQVRFSGGSIGWLRASDVVVLD